MSLVYLGFISPAENNEPVVKPSLVHLAAGGDAWNRKLLLPNMSDEIYQWVRVAPAHDSQLPQGGKIIDFTALLHELLILSRIQAGSIPAFLIGPKRERANVWIFAIDMPFFLGKYDDDDDNDDDDDDDDDDVCLTGLETQAGMARFYKNAICSWILGYTSSCGWKIHNCTLIVVTFPPLREFPSHVSRYVPRH